MNCTPRSSRTLGRLGGLASALALVFGLSLALATPTLVYAGAAPPNIDGNIADMIQFATELSGSNTGCGIVQEDKAGEVELNDEKIIPCHPVLPGEHYTNGFELIQYVLALAGGSNTLYLGLVTEGIVGDTDGNGDPNGFGGATCDPVQITNVSDQVGIGDDESYTWEFDTVCLNPAVFTPTGTITVRANAVSGTGVFAGITGAIAFAGSGLEVRVDNVTLPAAYKVRVVIGSIPDGLGEDRGPARSCEPNPGIEVTKTASPSTVCPGGTTRFTISIQNTGNSALDVVVVDDLPAGLTFAGNIATTCGVGAPVVVGQQITWPSFSLAFGASCSIAFDATAAAECFGSVQNLVTVTGSVSASCIKGGIISVSDSDTEDVVCGTAPCVEASALCDPAKACPGTPVDVTGSARNCSLGPEDITITIEGVPQSFDDVPAGESRSWTRTVNMPACTDGQQVTFTVVATASNDCGQAKPSTATCSVECTTPVIEVDKSADPAGEVEQGTTLHYTIVVTNPSKDVALTDVVVTDELCDEVTYANNADPAPTSEPAVGSGGSVVWNIPSIAAGASVTLTFDATVRELPAEECEAGRSCTNNVTAVGNCGDAEARATDSFTTPILCPPPGGLCRLTGGGCLNEDGGQRGHKQSTFGGNSSPAHEGGGPTGNEWTHVYRDGREILFNWHSHDAHVVLCTIVPPGPCHPPAENTRADFEGTGLYSIGAGGREEEGNMVAYIIDHREGACNKGDRDEYGIIVRTGLVIGQGDIVFQTEGEIDCGNLQIHETPARLFGNGTSLPPGTEVGDVAAVALLNKAYPNPFANQTSFSYRVSEASSPVEVGVYNVAGRLVKSLAAGSKASGTYTVTWDGTDEAGMRMSAGVYFLKSRVANDSTVQRLIYLAR